MLQQTVVSAVINHFQKWMSRFPTVQALATADEQEVMRFWEGLGYYSRARNLHKGASIVVKKYGGQIPDSYAALKTIPGIGDYTASAILSIAYGKAYPVLDANVRRVMQRVILIREWNRDSEEKIRVFLSQKIARVNPGEFNEALMELGQVLCRRTSPDCASCPLVGDCRAKTEKMQGEIPAKRKRTMTKLKSTVHIYLNGNKVLLSRRDTELFRGLWLFPGTPYSQNGSSESARTLARLKERTHFYTQFAHRLCPVVVECGNGDSQPPRTDTFKWVLINELQDYPMPSVYRRIADEFFEWYRNRQLHVDQS